MMKIKLPIWYYVGGDALTELDLAERPRVAEQQVFYSIDSIAPAKNETYIYSGGDTFVCPLPIGKVEDEIDRAKNYETLLLSTN